MKPGIQLRQSQQLSLTPQLQQAIRLLQLSQIELQTELRELAEANPLIELDGEASDDDAPAEASSSDNSDSPAESASADVDDSEYWDENSPQVMEWAQSSRGFDDDDTLDPQDAAPEGLRDHLQWQANLSGFS
jgi:RNA polymerase sigma-54 factor